MANLEQARRWNGETGRRWIAQRERHHAVRRLLTPHLLRAAALGSGDRVLDVGCGCGEVTIEMARSVRPGGEVYGLDLSGPALDVARGWPPTPGCRASGSCGATPRRLRCLRPPSTSWSAASG
ncbi:class I SAM-dependent methyltransferase [Micromonospora zhanjiangensis]